MVYAHHVQIRRGPYCTPYSYASYAGGWATPYTEHVPQVENFRIKCWIGLHLADRSIPAFPWTESTGPCRAGSPPATGARGPRGSGGGADRDAPPHPPPHAAAPPPGPGALHLAAALSLSLSSGEYTIHLGGQVQLLILSPFPSLPISLSRSLAHRDFLSCATSLVPRGVASSCRRSIRGRRSSRFAGALAGGLGGWLVG